MSRVPPGRPSLQTGPSTPPLPPRRRRPAVHGWSSMPPSARATRRSRCRSIRRFRPTSSAAHPEGTRVSEIPVAAEFHDRVRHAYIAKNLYLNSRLIQSHALDQAEIRRQRAMFVRTAAMDALAERLRTHRVVALVGPKGSGRRITAINALAELGLQPSEVPLDDGDTRELRGSPQMGYIAHADDVTSSSKPVQPCIGSAREQGLTIVFRVTSAVWRRVAPADVPEIPVVSAPALDIFSGHLAVSLGAQARNWNTHPRITDCLAPAGPRDAVRLTGLVEEAVSQTPDFSEELVGDVLRAYTNWEGELESSFSTQSY